MRCDINAPIHCEESGSRLIRIKAMDGKLLSPSSLRRSARAREIRSISTLRRTRSGKERWKRNPMPDWWPTTTIRDKIKVSLLGRTAPSCLCETSTTGSRVSLSANLPNGTAECWIWEEEKEVTCRNGIERESPNISCATLLQCR